ncbi:MAG TPA: O-antigen ligase family protein [bacterium]|nr:O-antigen ligase family protein [bacterium]
MGRLYQLVGFLSTLTVLYYCWNNSRGDRFRRALPLCFLVSFVFISIEAKSLSIPLLTYLVIGVIGIPAMIYGLLFRYEILLIIAALYIPNNAILPADFGGLQQALNGTNIVLAALILGMFAGSSKDERKYSGKSPANTMVWLYMATIVVSFARGSLYFGSAYYSSDIILDLKRFLTPMVLYLIFVRRLQNRSTIRIVVGVSMIVVIMAVYLGLLQWVNLGFGTYSGMHRRLGGLNRHPNNFGAFIVYYVGLMWGQFLVNFRRFDAKLLLLPLLMSLRILIPTNSRGAWVSLPPSLGVITFFKNPILLVILVLLAVVPFILNPAMIPDTIRYRFEDAAKMESSETIYSSSTGLASYASESRSISVRTRYLLLETGLHVWKQNPFFGHGYGVFQYKIREYTGGELGGSAHNGWLKMLVEMGIITLASIMLFFGYTVYCSYRVFRRERNPFLRGFALGYLGCAPAIIVANVTGQRLNHVDLLAIFWILSACIVKLDSIITQERYEEGLG